MRNPVCGCPDAAGGDHPADEAPRRVSDPAGGLLTRRAQIGPASLDLEARTAEAVLATSAPVRRHGERPDGSYGPWLEVLDPAGADLSRIVGGPVLLDHDAANAKSRIGVVTSVRREGGALIATLKFSDREEVATLLRDIAAGVGGAISVGYQIRQWGAG